MSVTLYSRRSFLINTSLLTAGMICYGFPSIFENQLKFGIITDTHYANRPSKKVRFYSQSNSKMNYAIDFFNSKNLDFIIHLGDLKDQDEIPNEISTLKYLKTIEKEFSEFKGKKYHVLGNHDLDSISKEQFLANIVNSGFDTAQSYYHFEMKGYQMIVLDANFSNDSKPYSKGNFNWKEATIPKHQLDWLRNVLNDSLSPCLLFIHHPIDNTTPDHYAVQNSLEVRNILEKSKKVLAVFQGHRHQESHTHINGIHYYTFNAMVDNEGLENNSFSMATINLKKGIQIDGYFRSSNFQHKFNY